MHSGILLVNRATGRRALPDLYRICRSGTWVMDMIMIMVMVISESVRIGNDEATSFGFVGLSVAIIVSSPRLAMLNAS
jgi:hypothetical protein